MVFLLFESKLLKIFYNEKESENGPFKTFVGNLFAEKFPIEPFEKSISQKSSEPLPRANQG